MDWTMENARDEAMLKLLDLGMLDVALAGNDAEVAAEIGAGNTRLVELTERFARLAEDRVRLNDHTAWLDSDSADIAAQRGNVQRESWDILLGLRKLLVDRAALLARLEAVADELATRLSRRHEQIRDRLCQSLDRERRKMVAASPMTGNWRFAELIDSNDDVEAARQDYLSARANLEAVLSARRKANGGIWKVKARQREVFPLVAA